MHLSAVFSYKSKVPSSLPVMGVESSHLVMSSRPLSPKRVRLAGKGKGKEMKGKGKGQGQWVFSHPGNLMAGTQKWRFGR